MPDTDWLTGISSRAAFARQVGQADQDRDQFAVAIIGLRHINEINRHLGFSVGDELLGVVGRALGERVGVGTTVARLGGAQFGMMTVGLDSEDVMAWLEPVVSGLRTAIAGWIFEQIDFHGTCPIEPTLMIGAAGGYSGQVWAEAAIALDVCEADQAGDNQGGSISIHDPTDARFSAIQEREDLCQEVQLGLDKGTTAFACQQIERCQNPNPLRPWFRIIPLHREVNMEGANTGVEATGYGFRPIDVSKLRSSIGVGLERHMVDKAAQEVTRRGGQTRVTVPLTWLVRTGRGLDYWLAPTITNHRVPASRFVFEVSEHEVFENSKQAIPLLADLTAAGAELVLAGCSGGKQTVAALDQLSIRYLRPDEELVSKAETGNRHAAGVLATLADMAADIGGDLVFSDCRPSFGRPGATIGFQELVSEPLGSWNEEATSSS